MAFCDLHLHSNASDGTQAPGEVATMAAGLGLAVISLTDHDTADGCREALEVGARLGVTVITGVEINTDYQGHEVHLLGYGFDPDNGPLSELLVSLRQEREERMGIMVARLQKQGLDVAVNEVHEEAGSGTIGRPHLARVLVRKNYVRSVSEAFDDLLAVGRSAYVPRQKLLPHNAIAAIHAAGAVSVVAHPGLIGSDEVVLALIQMGVMGLEVYHSEHRPSDLARYQRMATEAGLLMTGGSDYHGPGGKEHGSMGSPKVPAEYADNLMKAVALIKSGVR